jgi:uncharacterized Rossmann fold enzyme
MQYSDPLTIDKATSPQVGWLPLIVHSALANTVDDISANIESALQRDYIPFNELIGTKSGAVAVVGSGPSLKANWQKLKRFKGDIIACNSACQFLLERDIIPTYMMCFDADPLVMQFITRDIRVTYLLASRCPPSAFERIEGCKLVCWHAAGDERTEELLNKHKRMEPMVAGGSAAVTRAMVLAIPMGYRKIHIYGVDSSFANGETHISKSTTDERHMAVKCNGRMFATAPWMTQQAEDFKILIPNYSNLDGVEYIVHGDGLIPHIAATLGVKTDFLVWARSFVNSWSRKATILWQHV